MTGFRLRYPGDQLQERRLTGSVISYEGNQVARVERYADIVQYNLPFPRNRPVGETGMLDLDDRFRTVYRVFRAYRVA
ncbi:hypothetical protein D3C76_1616920 [compost metagenome]